MRLFTVFVLAVMLCSCGDEYSVLNNPHAAGHSREKILYSIFTSQPKHLDPVRTYNLDDANFIDQVYEPPLSYHYLKRPYELQPQTLTHMPTVTWLDAHGNVMLPGKGEPAFTRYEFELKRGIRYQPHPCFAQDEHGKPFYHFKSAAEMDMYRTFDDFTKTGTRELIVDDYIYEIKRMADPTLQMPIWDLVSHYIVGMNELREAIRDERKQRIAQHRENTWINLDDFQLPGVHKTDDFHFSITIRGKYPQFKYWLAFHFFAPVPVEADRFYHQPGFSDKNISLDTHPVGTGAFMMSEINPNEEIVLERNPNYHDDFYPAEGEAGDREKGLLDDAGKRLPLIDKAVFSMEKQDIPIWTKFLQGYYDRSGISNESFDHVVNISVSGIALSDEMQRKGIRLTIASRPETYYLGFNMLDPVVGGLDEKHRKLRQAVAIAFDQDEQISIFLNGRGETGTTPIPPGVSGYEPAANHINPWIQDNVNGKPQKKSIAYAKQLLADAGYPNGIDEKTGKPLVLNLDTTGGGIDDNPRFNWLIRQFRKIDVDLNIRATDYNRYQDKHEKGSVQIYFYGWMADYPDPENFLFLLYGPNGRIGSGGAGVNSSNYNNPEYNALFDRIKLMEDSPERLALIRRMIDIFQRDMPWASMYYPQSYVLSNPWMRNYKPNGISQAMLKYQDLDTALRERKQHEWNRPVLWPLALMVVMILLMAVPGYRAWRQRLERRINPGASW